MPNQGLRLEVTSLPLLARSGSRFEQIIRIEVHNPGDPGMAHLSLGKHSPPLDIEFGRETSISMVRIPEIDGEVTLDAVLITPQNTVRCRKVLEPRRRWRVHIIHHTHVDIGYTDLQTELYRHHLQIIDSALELCRATDHYPEEAKFRWLCETLWTAENYIRNRPQDKVDEFVRRIKEERIEVGALYLNVTELYSEEEFARSFAFMRELEERFGIKLTAAQNSDVNAVAWCVPQMLNQLGIRYLGMAVDEIRGRAPSVHRPFWWESKDGSRVLVWNADPANDWYAEGYRLGLGESYEEVLDKLPPYLARMENGYPREIYALHLAQDNIYPNPNLAEIVRRWNETWAYPRLIISTLSGFMRDLEQEIGDEVPTYRLGWPDYWADGNASAAAETALSRRTKASLGAAESMLALARGDASDTEGDNALLQRALNKMMFFDEHTWGSHASVYDPDSPDARAQWAYKSGQIYEAAVLASRVEKKALDRAAKSLIRPLGAPSSSPGMAGGRHSLPGIAVFNPTGWTRTDIAELIVGNGMEAYKAARVIDAASGEEAASELVSDAHSRRLVLRFLVRNIPAFGWKAYLVEENAQALDFSTMDDARIASGACTVEFGEEGDLISLTYRGRELVDRSAAFRFGLPIYEEITSREGRKALWDGVKRHDARFLRSAARAEGNYRLLDSPLSIRLRTTLSLKNFNRMFREIAIYPEIERVDMRFYGWKKEVYEPEALYIPFTFAAANPRIILETAGASMEVECEQLPGTCRDWYSVQTWADVRGRDRGVIWSPLDAPLVQISDINVGKWLERLRVSSGTILSWPMNNYWFTNFRAGQGGPFSFSYAFASHGPEWTDIDAARFGWTFNNPLRVIPLMDGFSGSKPWIPLDRPMLEVQTDGCAVAAVKPSKDGRIAVRLRELTGKASGGRLCLPGRRVRRACIADILERDMGETRITEGSAVFELPPFGLITLLIEV